MNWEDKIMLSTLFKLISFIFIFLFIWANKVEASDLYINQSGNNFDLDVLQDGNNHLIRGYHNNTASIVGNNIDLRITQRSSITTSTFSTAHVDINGNNNDVFIGQGVGTTNFSNFYQTDSQEAGNHNAKLYLQGSNNDIYMGQRNGSPNQAYSPHNIDTKVYGNGNDIGIFQGHDGSKSVNLTVNSNNNNITMYQMGYNSTHSATVTIDGNYATNFFMNQNNGYSSSSYTLNNFCNTSTGCNITVND